MKILFIFIQFILYSSYLYYHFKHISFIEILLFGLGILICMNMPNVYYLTICMNYLLCISIKDYKTYSISILEQACSIILFYPLHFHFISSLIFSIPSFILHKKKQWIGQADVFYLFIYGLLLGYERLIVAVFLSILFGFIFILLKKEKMIPYLTCLNIGVFISLLKGYTIYYKSVLNLFNTLIFLNFNIHFFF